MFKSASLVCLCVLPWLAMAQSQLLTPKFQNIGRTATAPEIKAWDIDVRPDFKGLPKGQGSVKQGEAVWEAQCASCHGSFAESSEFFTPIAGGTTPDDMKTGRAKSLLPGANQPQRTTLMKLSSLSTLWDYINRAMPWTAPKSLSTDQVYASTAYILYLSNVLPADFVLSDKNIRDVQARLPNRNGMTTAHNLWPGIELGGSPKPDVQGSNCMRNCAVQTALLSSLPEHARDAHGNLAEQSRALGASRGLETSAINLDRRMLKTSLNNPDKGSNSPTDQSIQGQLAPEKIANRVNIATVSFAQIKSVLDQNACLACHGMSSKLVGPSLKDIAARYKTLNDASALLSVKIKNGGQGVWGATPMPAQSLSLDEASQIAKWLMGGMPP